MTYSVQRAAVVHLLSVVIPQRALCPEHARGLRRAIIRFMFSVAPACRSWQHEQPQRERFFDDLRAMDELYLSRLTLTFLEVFYTPACLSAQDYVVCGPGCIQVRIALAAHYSPPQGIGTG